MKAADSLSSRRDGHDHSHYHHGYRHVHGPGHHDHDHDLRGASRRSLKTVLALIASFMVVEVVGGVLSGSLSLLADAGHMLTDAASIVLALVALHFSDLPASWERTYGYRRLEVLAALINALSLCVIIGGVLWEAHRRLRTVPEVEGGLMLGIGLAGLLVNVLAMLVLRRSAKGNLNVEGALQHIVADLFGSVAVVISGALVWAFGWTIVDPILSVVISLLIGISAWRLLAKVFNVLLQGVPEHVDLHKLCAALEDLPGVTFVHDVHVWSLASDYDVLTAHILVDPALQIEDLTRMRAQVQELAKRDYNLRHITVQLEFTTDGCQDEEHHFDHHHRLRRDEVPA
ncbi:MAG: cation diffusion facilitator family transporter [Caldilineaceae bacterium]|nr:cation diffusion facilitator family transporter [Caldilineaceae bacterium]